MSDARPPLKQDDDPRAISDRQLREDHSREEVQKWREEAAAHHARWMEVMKNDYGKS